jgi:2'-5' RNA ligase|tara:strand:- start:536 stop:1168 length:633 start_codon:yes stop_codon:yes gene_type:complete
VLQNQQIKWKKANRANVGMSNSASLEPPGSQLYFIALLPPPAVRQDIRRLQEYVSETYASKVALKSPPHITLQPPFTLAACDVPLLTHVLAAVAVMAPPVEIELSGFSAIAPRVVFLDVAAAPSLAELQLLLADRLQTQCGVAKEVPRRRHYHPHLTIAFRDLKRRQFGALWEEVRERSVHYAFTVTDLTLLWHDGKRWQVDSEFALSGS